MTTNPGTDLVIDSSPISSEAIHNVSSAIASAASIQTNQSRGSNPSPQDNDQAQLATKESLENIVTYIINRFCKYGQGTTTEISVIQLRFNILSIGLTASLAISGSTSTVGHSYFNVL